MQNLLSTLTELLNKDDRFTSEGQLLKNKIIESTLQLDPKLLKLLISKPTIKKHFFQKVENILVFDKYKFQKFISSKSFLPDSYTAFKNKIGLTVEDEYLSENKDVVLSWPYKDCILEGGQTKEDDKRNETFWNETLAPDEVDRLLSPKVLTNLKKFDANGEHNVSEITLNENLLIKGNNLLALSSILEVYRSQIKLIYIDPPYNTGNDGFDYNDSFNHSSWLTFLKNRLKVAKELLKPDGTITISIDHNELGYLLVLLDEIFGVENRKNIITIKRGSVTGAKVINPGVVNISEYVVIYSRNTNNWNPNRVFSSKEWDRRYNQYILNYELGYKNWEFTTVLEAFAIEVGIPKTKLKKHFNDEYESELELFVYRNIQKIIQPATLDNNSISQSAKELKKKSILAPDKIFFLKRENAKPYYIHNGKLILFARDRITNIDGIDTFSQPITDIWEDVLPNDLHNEGGVQLRKGKKPEKLISRLVELCTNENDLVLDFFSGSGTTGTVCLKSKRRFIICEQLEYTQTLPLQRLLNTIEGEQSGVSKSFNWQGGGSFIYCELAKLNQKFVDEISLAKTTKKLKTIWDKIQKKGFLSYKINPKIINENYSEFEQLPLEDQKKFLIEVLDKNHLYVNYSEINDKDYKISIADKKLNKQLYALK